MIVVEHQCLQNLIRPSSCICDQDQDQAQKNVILGSSSDPRIKFGDQDQILGSGSPLILGPKSRIRIKFWDQDQGEKLGSRLILILI